MGEAATKSHGFGDSEGGPAVTFAYNRPWSPEKLVILI